MLLKRFLLPKWKPEPRDVLGIGLCDLLTNGVERGPESRANVATKRPANTALHEQALERLVDFRNTDDGHPIGTSSAFLNSPRPRARRD